MDSTVRNQFWCKHCKFFLIVCWFLGFLIGMSAADAAGETLSALMRETASYRASMIGLFTCAILPFLLSALAVFVSGPWLLLPVCLLKAFGFGFCAFGVHLAFGTAGWLVRLLLLFTDTLIMPVLFWFWLNHLQGTPSRRVMTVCVITAFAIAAMDYFLISPFWQSL